jgi:hypothetical protein
VLSLLAMAVAALLGQEGWFPFAIPPSEAQPGVTNLAPWNERPAGAHGPIRVQEGHFVDGAGHRIRFFGTNLCFGATVPSHASAEKIAARLASLGINVVRLHHMDSAEFPRGLWDPQDRTHRTLSAEALDRLDYLVAQLIDHGIYVNINLHVGRSPHPTDPAPQAESLPKYGKGVDNFWRPLIDFQKWYAKQLLDRVNKYTGRSYLQEPGVAFVEISNEDSLTTLWLRGDGLDTLPPPYQAYLDQRWQEWLRQRYGTREQLRRAWSQGERPLGDEQATNGDFHAGTDGWQVQALAPCEMTQELTRDGPEGAPALKLTVTTTDTVGWHGQAFYLPVAVRAGEPYTVAVWLRAEPAREVNVNVMRAREPWDQLGLSVRCQVGPQWQRFVFGFRATNSADEARVTISDLARQAGSVWISGLSLRSGGVVGLPAGESLDTGQVRRIPAADFGRRTDPAVRDQCLFYLTLEREYWQEMYDYLKHQLGLQALVTGTQITYTPPYTHEMMDYVDAHAYWQHPAFPGRPWDARNWYVRNISMVTQPPGTLGWLAAHRLAGKPYVVSEYNHPAPNQYGSEALLFLSSFGAFQDWDAIYGFAFTHEDNWQVDHVNGYFDMAYHPAQLVTFPVAAALFRRGDVEVGRELVAPGADLDTALTALQRRATSVSAFDVGVSTADILRHRVALRWGVKPSGPPAPPAASQQPRFISDTDQLEWDARQEGRQVLLIRTPRTKGVLGFCCGQQHDLGDGVRVVVGNTSLHWAALVLTQLQGDRVGAPGDLLMVATSGYRNPGWGWQELGGDRVTLGPQWGQGPVEVEGVSARLWLPLSPARVRGWALDERGQPRQPLEARPADGGCVVEIGPQYRTLWYHLVLAD